MTDKPTQTITIEITNPATAAIVVEKFEDSEAGRACLERIVADITAPHIALIHDLLAHLDYCGWGDRWERECSEDLQRRAKAWQEANPAPAPPATAKVSR